MAGLIYSRIIGPKNTKWIKPILLGALAFFLWFAGTYSWLTDTFLSWSVIGITNIPAKILALLLAMMAWDSRLIGL